MHHTGLTEELVDCSGGEDVSLESGTLRKLDALGRCLRKHAGMCNPACGSAHARLTRSMHTFRDIFLKCIIIIIMVRMLRTNSLFALGSMMSSLSSCKNLVPGQLP